ncbi:non-specific serine/threonine protein kinase [Ranunculus cassubicifolius]
MDILHLGGFLILLLLTKRCISDISYGEISPGFEMSQMSRIDDNGVFLMSNDSNFALRFDATTYDSTLFLLQIVHFSSSRIIWTANRGSPVKNFDKFVFDVNGNAFLGTGGHKVWTTDTAGNGATAMSLHNSGNLILIGSDGRFLWESFSHPTDTLLSNQTFLAGMRLESDPNPNGVSYYLQLQSGDLLLYAGYKTPQPYWSMGKDNRRTVNRVGGNVSSASLGSNSWRLFDQKQVLLWQFIFAENSDVMNTTWAAVLGSNGIISFYDLQDRKSNGAERIRIPQDSCSTPESCDSYNICYNDNRCRCPSVLSSHSNCKPENLSHCTSNKTSNSVDLVSLGERFDYFALEFVPPFSKSDLTGCKDACLRNCSCLVFFFESSSGNCYLLEEIGSLRQLNQKSNKYVTYVKLSKEAVKVGLASGGKKRSGSKKQVLVLVIIVVATILIIGGILYLKFKDRCRKKQRIPTEESSEEDNFFENLSGMPIRFSYEELETATEKFCLKLGHGGFGSVYRGVLRDGTKVAVKQLEGIGQGKKEFRAEVSIIGSIHHVHLVRLKGFCAEGSHRLLVYEYMENGSLDKWIFTNENSRVLDWGSRFNIALGMAKGLAYLHEDCDVKIVHCDIKPENVLLGDNYQAKVSDFGLAKLMTREQSHVFTTLRGTRGYLAPEWLTNYAISEKSDVYSFGMVLLEIIGGRKNFDIDETSEKSHFPSYAFRMMEEGKLHDVLDSKLRVDPKDERVLTATKVALWCIQEDMHLRPSMSRVVQMLEGVIETPQPPISFQMGSRLHSSFYKLICKETTLSEPSQCYTNASISMVQLSGPR